MPDHHDESDPKKKTGPTWRFYFGCFAFLLLLGIGVVIAYNIGAKTAFETHLEELAAMGESIRFEDLQPPAVEDPDQNFAKAPIIRHLRGLPVETGNEQESDWSHQGTPKILDIPGYDHIPSDRTRTLRYLSIAPAIEHFPGMEAKEALETVATYSESYSESITALREAAKRPSCNFESDYSLGYSMTFAGITELQNFVRLLNLQARLMLSDGNPQAAFENLNVILAIAQHVSSEPVLIHQLVKIAFLGMAISTIQEGLSSSSWTEEQLHSFQELLAEISVEPDYMRSLRIERAFFLNTVVKDPPNALDEWKDSGMLPSELERFAFAIPRGWIYDNALKYSQIYQESLLTGSDGKPNWDRIPLTNSLNTELGKITSGRISRIRYTLVSLSLPAHTSITERFLRSGVYLDHVQLAIALELFRQEKGQFPAELSAVKMSHGKNSFLDPFTNKLYVYELVPDDTYQIYSIGPNRTDEGGLLKKKTELGDWVWRLTLPENFDYDEYRG